MASLTLSPLNSSGIAGTTVRYIANIIEAPFGTLKCVWYVNGIQQAETTRFFNYVASGRPGVKTIRCVGTFTPTEGAHDPQVFENSTTFTVEGPASTLEVELTAQRQYYGELSEHDIRKTSYGMAVSYTAHITGDEGPGTYAYEFFHAGIPAENEGTMVRPPNEIYSYLFGDSFLTEDGKPIESYTAYVVVTFTPDDGDVPIVFSSVPKTYTFTQYDYFPEIELSYNKATQTVSAKFTPEIPSNIFQGKLGIKDYANIETYWAVGPYDGTVGNANEYEFLYDDMAASISPEVGVDVTVYLKDCVLPVFEKRVRITIIPDIPGPSGGCEDFYVHPLPHRDSVFVWIGWWLAEEIHKMTLAGADWKTDTTWKYWPKRCTLAKLLIDYPNMEVQESRHGRLLKRSHFESGYIYDYYKY